MHILQTECAISNAWFFSLPNSFVKSFLYSYTPDNRNTMTCFHTWNEFSINLKRDWYLFWMAFFRHYHDVVFLYSASCKRVISRWICRHASMNSRYSSIRYGRWDTTMWRSQGAQPCDAMELSIMPAMFTIRGTAVCLASLLTLRECLHKRVYGWKSTVELDNYRLAFRKIHMEQYQPNI